MKCYCIHLTHEFEEAPDLNYILDGIQWTEEHIKCQIEKSRLGKKCFIFEAFE